MKRIFLLTLFVCALFFIPAAYAQKVERLDSAPTGLPDSIAQLLDPSGYHVTDASGAVLCDIWFSKAIPVREKTTVQDSIYTELEESTFVGVISYPKSGQSFRGPAIQPGVYLLRFGLQPMDGDHLGTAPSRDFFLITPTAEDKDPNTKLDYKSLSALSAKAMGQNHPGVLSLVYPSGGDVPSVRTNDEGHVILETKVKTAAGSDLPLALIVKGSAPQ